MLFLFRHSVVSNSLQPHGLQHASFPGLHCLPELDQTHVHWVNDAIQPLTLCPFNMPPKRQHLWLFKHVININILYRQEVISRQLSGEESACQCRRRSFNFWVGKIPWRRKWKPTLVFSPGKSHGQRSLAGYSPWSCKRVGHDLATKQQQ